MPVEAKYATMAKRLAFTEFNLGYPPWALEFDPEDRGYLFVGGGGGEGQKEVPNKLTLLDVASRSKISQAGELATYISEDSPTSLGVVAVEDGLIAYTGLNSGAQDREKGVNEHFRAFAVKLPKRSQEFSAQGSISRAGQTTFFSENANGGDVFQRLLRLSPASKSTGGKRIGAIANSLAKESQIVLFDATSASPSSADIIERIKPVQNAEANDIDIFETKPGDFLLAFCTQTDIYLQLVTYDFTAKKARKPKEPYAAYSVPSVGASQKLKRPKVRSLRFLTADHLLLLVNKGSLSELVLLRIYHDGSKGAVVLRKQLPKRMGAAVSMDVRSLDADATTGAKQIVVAVAAQAEDISIATIDYLGTSKNCMSRFTPYTDFRGVHNIAMKKVCLAPYYSPWIQPTSTSGEEAKAPGPQYLRLASISLSNTVVVDYLPLRPVSPTKRGSRYALTTSPKSSPLMTGGSVFGLATILLVALLLFQAVSQAQTGKAPQVLPQALVRQLDPYASRISNFLSPYLREVEETHEPRKHSKSAERIKSLLHLHHKSRDVAHEEKKSLVLVAGGGEDAVSSHEVHADTAENLIENKDAKRWEDLSTEQQSRWKKRMVACGAWSANYGETILKGVFFSEVAGAVGRAAAQAVAGN